MKMNIAFFVGILATTISAQALSDVPFWYVEKGPEVE
jgi:hypothetical protein